MSLISTICALGNSEKSLNNTHHNIGFIIMNNYAKKINHIWKLNKKMNIFLSYNNNIECNNSENISLIKPNSAMNINGEILSKYFKKNKINAQSILLIHDDFSLPFGQVKLSINNQASKHKGVENFFLNFKKSCNRLKIGINPNKKLKISLRHYVLSEFSEDQKTILKRSMNCILNTIDIIRNSKNITFAMNLINRKKHNLC